MLKQNIPIVLRWRLPPTDYVSPLGLSSDCTAQEHTPFLASGTKFCWITEHGLWSVESYLLTFFFNNSCWPQINLNFVLMMADDHCPQKLSWSMFNTISFLGDPLFVEMLFHTLKESRFGGTKDSRPATERRVVNQSVMYIILLLETPFRQRRGLWTHPTPRTPPS